MKHILTVGLACLILGMFPLMARAQEPKIPADESACPRLDAFAGAGLAGSRTEEVLTEPVYAEDNGVWREQPELVRLVKNWRYSWRSAAAGGLTIGCFARSSGFGAAIGAHVVILPTATDGSTDPRPAITLHLGTPDLQVYFGVVFISTPEVRLPNGESEVITTRDVNPSSFVLPGLGKRGAFYWGVRLLGT